MGANAIRPYAGNLQVCMDRQNQNEQDDSQALNRRSLRLREYDYSQEGAYFVTVCTYKKRMIFTDIRIKRIVEKEWLKTPIVRPYITLDEFVVMPNHLHGIIIINHHVGAYGHTPLRGVFRSPSKSLGAIIRGFKASSKIKINEFRNAPKEPVWQRNYYDHVIRNEADLSEKRKYIIDNPAKWDEDEYYSNNPSSNRFLE